MVRPSLSPLGGLLGLLVSGLSKVGDFGYSVLHHRRMCFGEVARHHIHI